MKKLWFIILTAIISLSLTACGQPAPQANVVAHTPVKQTSAAPAGSPTPVSTPNNATATSSPAIANMKCRQEPLAGVYHPSRLEIKEACKTVSGTVETVRHESDGDYHINLKLDSQYANLINDKNTKDEHGNLVVEIIPLDEPNIPPPKKGQHITVTGAYVIDKHHGWMEIHPAWIIDGKGSVTYDKAAAEKSAASPADEDEQADTTETTPQPKPSTASNQNVYYAKCADVRAAGKAPLHRGDPGYRPALDRDGDGIACE